MAQNIYDNEEFFRGYSGLSRSIQGLEGAPEWPALRALLPDVGGRNVLDLGCGFGWFCRWAREHGAGRVLGIDVSEKMLARARAAGPDPQITYRRADLETLELDAETRFDLVYSSLAFHYIQNLDRLLSQVYRALVPGGRLVFSVEHPIYTAPLHPHWEVDASGHRTWPVDSYLKEGLRVTNWLTEGVVKQHRSLGTYANLLVGIGFSIAHLEDWGPTDEQIAAQPELAEERERPTFLLAAANRGRGEGETR